MEESLAAYAARALRQGSSPDQVRDTLRGQGWGEPDIADALEGAAVIAEQPEPRLAPEPRPLVPPAALAALLAVIVIAVVAVILLSGGGGGAAPQATPEPTAEPTSRPAATVAPTAAPRPPARTVSLVGVAVRARGEGEFALRDFTLDAIRLVYGVLAAPGSQARYDNVTAFLEYCRNASTRSPELERDLSALGKGMEDYRFYLETNNVPRATEVLTNDIFGMFHATAVAGQAPVTVSVGFGRSIALNLTSATSDIQPNVLWETSHLVVPEVIPAWERDLLVDASAARRSTLDVLYLDASAIDAPEVAAPSFRYFGRGERRPYTGDGFAIPSLEGVVDYRIGGEVCTSSVRSWSGGKPGEWRCVDREKEDLFLARREVRFDFLDLGPVLPNLTGVYRSVLDASLAGGVEHNFTFLHLQAKEPFTLEGAKGTLSSLGLRFYKGESEGTPSCPVHVVETFTSDTRPVYYVSGVAVGQYLMLMYTEGKPNPVYLTELARSSCS